MRNLDPEISTSARGPNLEEAQASALAESMALIAAGQRAGREADAQTVHDGVHGEFDDPYEYYDDPMNGEPAGFEPLYPPSVGADYDDDCALRDRGR